MEIQVRAWPSFAGSSYDSALNYALQGNTPIAFLGESIISTYTFGSPLPYRPNNFVLTPVPEPSTFAFAILGTGALLLSGVRRRGNRLKA